MLHKPISKRFLISQILLVLFLIPAFCNGVVCGEKFKDKLWYKHAEEYIKADQQMIQHAIEKKETFLEDYNLRYEAELKLINSPLPTALELEELLNSQDVLGKKVAIVNIMKKKIYSEILFKTILRQHDSNDDFFTKFYTYQCFKLLNKDKMKRFEDDFIKILSFEKNESLIITAMPTLLQVETSKVIPLFVRYFKNGTTELRRSSYIHLKKMGEQYLQEVKEILREQNAVEALVFIKQAESGNKP